MRDFNSTPKRSHINRRAFLRGAGGAIAVGLPFLEGLPERSAWAQGDNPTFGMYVCAANGVVPQSFAPSQAGPLDAGALAGKAVGELSDFVDNLLIVRNIGYPSPMTNCGHAQGLCQALTGTGPNSGGSTAQAGGVSADVVVSGAVNPQGVDPLTLYSGAKSYIGERLSFAGPGTARAAQLNPYAIFQTLMGVSSDTAPSTPVGGDPGGGASEPANEVDALLLRRKSVNDTVRDQLSTLMSKTALSAEDRQRLTQHFDAVRQIEINLDSTGQGMMEMSGETQPAAGGACSIGNLNLTGIEAFKNGVMFTQNGNLIEDIVKLHFEVVALAFACNANRVASLQWGDGTDQTKYAGISGPGWPFHQISHRVQSDGALGNNASAEQAHAEIDVIRMKTLAHGIQHFKDRGLLDKAFIYWTNHVATGAHTFNDLPVVIAGSGGGFLKQGQVVNGNANNATLLASLMTANGAPTDRFGAGNGQLTSIHA